MFIESNPAKGNVVNCLGEKACSAGVMSWKCVFNYSQVSSGKEGGRTIQLSFSLLFSVMFCNTASHKMLTNKIINIPLAHSLTFFTVSIIMDNDFSLSDEAVSRRT